MERQIFEWLSWESFNEGLYYFYDCTLIKDFGPLKKGEFYDEIVMSTEHSFFQFHDRKNKKIFEIYFQINPTTARQLDAK